MKWSFCSLPAFILVGQVSLILKKFEGLSDYIIPVSQVKIELKNHYYWLLRIHVFLKFKPYFKFCSIILIVRDLKNIGSEKQTSMWQNKKSVMKSLSLHLYKYNYQQYFS